jgi:uncharacterized membrane protein
MGSSKAAVTVVRPRDEVERLWRDPAYKHEHIDGADADVRFVDAPGDHGTEIHVEIAGSGSGAGIGGIIRKLTGAAPPLIKARDDLRRFKQLVETGVVSRSEASPEGERAERKLHERPGQPMAPAEREEVNI